MLDHALLLTHVEHCQQHGMHACHMTAMMLLQAADMCWYICCAVHHLKLCCMLSAERRPAWCKPVCTRVGDLAGGLTESHKDYHCKTVFANDHCKTVFAWHRFGSSVTHCGMIYMHVACTNNCIFDMLCVGLMYNLGSLQAATVMHRLCCSLTSWLATLINHQMADANDKHPVSALYLVIICFSTCMRQQQSDFEAL